MGASSLVPTISPAGGGSVSITLHDTYSDAHRTTYEYVITATAAAGYVFDHIEYTEQYEDLWDGGTKTETRTEYSSSFYYTETVDHDTYNHYGNYTLVSLTAYFRQTVTQYTITVSASPAAGGVVSGGGTYNAGSTCTVYATPNQGYIFVGWWESGTRVSGLYNYSFTVTGNRTLVAHFHAPTNLLVNSFNKSSPVQLCYDPTTGKLVADF